MAIHVGTSGFVYPHWRGVFYPTGLLAREQLPFYARSFHTVEMNTTFYRLPTEEAVAGWAAATPADFRFVCKGSRYLTHMKRLLDTGEGIARFFARVDGLGRKLRVVLWQLPPQMARADPERLDRFLAALPRHVRHVVEFRHVAWYTDEVCDVLDRHRAAFCEHDLARDEAGRVAFRPPPRVTGGFRYLRFHGATSHDGRYGARALAPHARDLLDWDRPRREAWVFFNNDVHGHALCDARDFAELCGQRLALSLATP